MLTGPPPKRPRVPAPQIFGGSRPEAEVEPKTAAADAAEDQAEGDAPGTEDETWDHERIQAVLQAESADALDHHDTVIAPERTQANQYYRGDPFGNEQEGRSQVVSMDERDTILSVLPSLVRMFLGSERAVELIPERPDQEDAARQRTDYINYVIRKTPQHFAHFYGAFKDAMLRAPGAVLKWWWETKTDVKYETYTGLTQDQVQRLAEGTDVDHVSYTQTGTVPIPADGLVPADATPQGEQPIYEVRIRRKLTKGMPTFALIPGEQILWNREATGFHDARYIQHRQEVTRSDLIAMGYTAAQLEEIGLSQPDVFRADQEYLDRRTAAIQNGSVVGDINPEMETALYAEHLLYLDRDGDEIAELTRVCTLGEQFAVLLVEDAPEVNYALFTMDPEPNEFGGTNFHRLVKDLQLIKSAVMRALMDSLRASVDPRIAAMADQVNMDDLLNPEIGGVIRTEGDPNMVLRVLEVPFSGQAGLAVLEHLDGVKEARTGQTRGSQGLDAETMQSTTAMAIGAQLSAAQQKIELIGRVLAETGFKPFFSGMQRLIMRHQDIPQTIRLRGQWVDVNPATWEAEMDVQVNVGLGAGIPSEKIDFIQGVVNKQESILKELGPSPIVDYELYANTLVKAAEAGGFTDGTKYFGRVPKGWAPPPPPQQPDPAVLLAQIEQSKVQAQIENDRAKLAQAREEMLLRTETERMRLEAETQLKVLELNMKFGQQADAAQLTAQVEHTRTVTEAAIRAHEAEVEQMTRAHEAETAAAAQQAQQASAPTEGA